MNSQEELIQELKKLTLKSVEQFSFNGINTLAMCARVYDGDTITVMFEFKDEFIKSNLRLTGLDTPELHSAVEAEAEAARIGQQYLSNLILNEIIRVELGDLDKYGRILATIYTFDSNENINQLMITKGFARAYGEDGDLHKGVWTEDELNKAKQNLATVAEPAAGPIKKASTKKPIKLI